MPLRTRADAVLLGDAVECGRQDDDQEADNARLCKMFAQCDDEDHRNDGLYDDHGLFGLGALRRHFIIKFLEHFANQIRRQLRTVAERLRYLEQHAGNQTDDQYGHRDVRHAQEELEEVPAHDLGDQKILWFTDQRRHTTERRTDRTVHHQVAQKCAELREVLTVHLDARGRRPSLVMI